MTYKKLKVNEILKRFDEGELLYCKKESYIGKDIINNSWQYCAVQTPDDKIVCLFQIDSLHEWEIMDNLDLHRLLMHDWYVEEEE